MDHCESGAHWILSRSSGSTSGAESKMDSICSDEPRDPLRFKYSTVRNDDTFSARAKEINWLMDTPSSLESSLTSRWMESGNLTLSVDMDLAVIAVLVIRLESRLGLQNGRLLKNLSCCV